MSGLCSFTLNPCFSLLDFPVRREHWTEVNMTWMLLLPQHTLQSVRLAGQQTCYAATLDPYLYIKKEILTTPVHMETTAHSLSWSSE